eukprot:gene1311-480_t
MCGHRVHLECLDEHRQYLRRKTATPWPQPDDEWKGRNYIDPTT